MQLELTALPSIQSQTDRNFEWIVINDGANLATRDIITRIKATADFPIIYIEMEHSLPSSGFSLCYGRNVGLNLAGGDIISYLDDDNSLAPEFVASMRQHFQKNPNIRYSMARQQRRRDVMHNGNVIRQGKLFVSPCNCCSLQQLLWQQEIFDSNGFVHYHSNAPQWNPQFKVFADYEYLLQSACIWGEDGFEVNNNILVNYIQSSVGVIGSSNYEQWATELSLIVTHKTQYSILQSNVIARLEQLVQSYQNKA